MITRLLVGILACVFLPLGIAFSIVFGTPGLPFLAVGLALAAAFAVLHRRAAAVARRREARATAQIVRAHLHAGVRIGVLLTYDLTVTFTGSGGEVTERVLVAPNVPVAPGGTIEIAYDPAQPSNFAPVR